MLLSQADALLNFGLEFDQSDHTHAMKGASLVGSGASASGSGSAADSGVASATFVATISTVGSMSTYHVGH